MVKPRIVQVKHLHAHFTNSSLINWKHISTVRFDDAVDIKKKYDGASSPGFELVSPRPFPTTITITLRAPDA